MLGTVGVWRGSCSAVRAISTCREAQQYGGPLKKTYVHQRQDLGPLGLCKICFEDHVPLEYAHLQGKEPSSHDLLAKRGVRVDMRYTETKGKTDTLLDYESRDCNLHELDGRVQSREC
jgi:hypothetical protein